VESTPKLTPSSRKSTSATATLSVAEADTVIVPRTVDPDVGAVMAADGGVVSGPGSALKATICMTHRALLAVAVAL